MEYKCWYEVVGNLHAVFNYWPLSLQPICYIYWEKSFKFTSSAIWTLSKPSGNLVPTQIIYSIFLLPLNCICCKLSATQTTGMRIFTKKTGIFVKKADCWLQLRPWSECPSSYFPSTVCVASWVQHKRQAWEYLPKKQEILSKRQIACYTA